MFTRGFSAVISACFPATTSSELQVITRHVGIQMKRLKVVDFIRSSEVFNGRMMGEWWETGGNISMMGISMEYLDALLENGWN